MSIPNASTLFGQLQLMGLFNINQQNVSSSPNLQAFFENQAFAGLTPTSTSQVTESKQNDAYCDICDKVYCNRYFLKTHRLKKHGIADSPISTTTPTVATISSPSKTETDWTAEPQTPQRSESPMTNLNEHPTNMPRLTTENEDTQSPESGSEQQICHSCDSCEKEFDSLTHLLQHQLVHHNANQQPTPQTPKTPISHPPPSQPSPQSQQHTPISTDVFNTLSQLLPNFQFSGGNFQQSPLLNLGNFQSGLPLSEELDVARIAQQLTASQSNGLQNTGITKTPKRQYSSTGKNVCDLCNKELCNKYFLRTHMLKMHKIVLDENKSIVPNIDSSEKEKEGDDPSPCDMCSLKVNTPSILEQLNLMGLMNGNQQNGSSTPDLQAFFETQALAGLTPTSTSQVTQSKQNDAYCDICDKVLCNRYFLKTHRLKKHGIVDSPISTTTPTVATISSPSKTETDWTAEPQTPQRSESPMTNLSEPPAKMPRLTTEKEETQSSESGSQQQICHSCDSCEKEFDSLTHLLQHQLVHHNANQQPTPQTPKTPISHPPPSQPSPQSQQHTPISTDVFNTLSQLLPNFHLPPLFNMGNFQSGLPFGQELDVARIAQLLTANQSNGPQNTGIMKTPKRQYTSTSKNYCDLCNKEVCNKYFLRTHMLKMHKIVIDENKTVIANIDTLEKEKEGDISFRCDLCRLKLDTRQELRDHKREVHNIAPAANQSATN
ncbi:hypothetical protein M3Y98_00955100 [Aphelenchoides besseyi]|nr:hypothetical protein M3Y98_00955100 [Aphelenchoides besseyi]KAI6194612.1 hypothetical protein M3Y96_01143200 [Aphelenchoides besseyi]